MENSQKMLLIFLALGGAGLLGVLTVNSLQKGVTKIPTIETIPVPPQAQNMKNNQTGTDVYFDPEFGISLEIPKTWQGVYRAQKVAAQSGIVNSERLNFGYVHGQTDVPLFYIARTTEEKWNQIRVVSSMMLTKLMQIGDIVYYTEDARTYPRELRFPDGKEVNSEYKIMAGQIPQILSTFSYSDTKTGVTVRSQTKEEKGIDKYFETQTVYPVFVSNNNQQNFESLNAEVEKQVNSWVEEFKKEVADEDLNIDPEIKSSVWVEYGVTLLTPEIVSIRFDVSQYMRGAAHPNNFTQTINYSLKENKVLALSDVFKKESKYIQELSKISREEFAKTLKAIDAYDENTVKQGTEPKAENFQNFVLTPTGLTIFFDPYTVGPYALGRQEVKVPFEKVKNMLVSGIVK